MVFHERSLEPVLQPTHTLARNLRREPRARDPLLPVKALERRLLGVASAVALLGSLVFHGTFAWQGLSSAAEIGYFAAAVDEYLHQQLVSEVDVELAPPEPPKPLPEPEPPKDPELPEPTPRPEFKEAKELEPPPAPPSPAEAAAALTREPGDEPELLEGFELATGNAERYAGGFTARVGKSKTPVLDNRASPSGVPGGTGKVAAPVMAERDLSQPARPLGESWNSCGLPPEAELAQVYRARVELIVQVDASGVPTSAKILKDPGYGFGARARRCALRKKFETGRDRTGKPIPSTTPPFSVKFDFE